MSLLTIDFKQKVDKIERVNMKRRLTILGIMLVSVCSLHAYPTVTEEPNTIEITEKWTALMTLDGIEVEYKFQECNNQTVRNQVLVLFRFKNTSAIQSKTINWSVKEFRNDVCTNCAQLEAQEVQRSLTLSPGEIVEGDGTSKADNRVYLFSHFIKLVPGMTDQKLTHFEFHNVTVENL